MAARRSRPGHGNLHGAQDSACKEAWQVTENFIKLMHAEVESRGKVFMAITVSSGPQVGPDQAARQALERRLGVADLFYSENQIRAGKNSFEVLALYSSA